MSENERNVQISRRLVRFLLFVLIALVILSIWQTFGSYSKNNQDRQYPYLSKRIFAEKQNDILINFTPLRATMRQYVNAQNGSVGSYFEYLPSGVSIGVNDTIETNLASLGKIPSVMALYKVAEAGGVKIDQTVTVTPQDIDKGFGQLWKRGVGYSLSLEDAVNLTLQESDNTAHSIIKRLIKPDDIADVMIGLDIPVNKDGNQFTISPKNYTSILRSLYLSSYLTREHSDEILSKLSGSIFTDKLPAGVPDHIKVAHKIGVFTTRDSSSPAIYSDCGIIYVPNRPYSLCVMVRNSDEAAANTHIRTLSEMAYQYVSSAE